MGAALEANLIDIHSLATGYTRMDMYRNVGDLSEYAVLTFSAWSPLLTGLLEIFSASGLEALSAYHQTSGSVKAVKSHTGTDNIFQK
ncbi:hypothetical protein BGZ47_010507 [Haplosporangium gracile]|nr:hypothetical protein BGZ47_010507 [Haplosporangium gracile]